MKKYDVKRNVDSAINIAKLITKQKPKSLSDNGSCKIIGELKSYLKNSYQMDRIHGSPNLPQIPGKIEHYYRTIKT